MYRLPSEEELLASTAHGLCQHRAEQDHDMTAFFHDTKTNNI